MAQKVAYVTGGMGGIGTAICQRLHKDGFKVIAGCGPSRDFTKWLDEQKALGYTFYASVGNVADWESTVEAFTKAVAEHGPIDVLVNNAGITKDRMFLKMTPEDWHAVIDTNLNSMFNVTKQVVPDMVEKRLGPHHPDQLGQRRKGPGRPDQLLGGQGRHARLHDGAGAGTGRQGRDGQHRQPRATSAPTWSARSSPRCWRRSSHDSRSSGWARPTRSPRSSAWLAGEDSGFTTGADFSCNGGLHMGDALQAPRVKGALAAPFFWASVGRRRQTAAYRPCRWFTASAKFSAAAPSTDSSNCFGATQGEAASRIRASIAICTFPARQPRRSCSHSTSTFKPPRLAWWRNRMTKPTPSNRPPPTAKQRLHALQHHPGRQHLGQQRQQCHGGKGLDREADAPCAPGQGVEGQVDDEEDHAEGQAVA
jgi:acetoacetyl-CoA reductase